MRRRHFLLGAATAFALGRPYVVRAEEKLLRIAYPDKSPPSSWEDDDRHMRGVMVDLMAEVAKIAGYRFQPIARPLPRVQIDVENGEADGMCLVVTPARQKYALAAGEALTTGPITLFVRRDNPALPRLQAVRSLDDLARADVTVIGITGNGWVKKNIEERGIRTRHASGTIGTVRMLIGRRGDVVADMSSQINWILKNVEGAADIVELPTVIEQIDWHLQISRKSPFVDDLPAMTAAIKELKASPLYESILKKYGMKV
ncbi:substrate-binding periplasmic protein [Dongia sp.]|uniref:substrate-binding periplasmic protein n=1 Tax=Dongia sp. TaxID=1977262 RepID=UPI0035B02EC4